jgi:predicted lipid-binding transport protein (Tim44 family)
MPRVRVPVRRSGYRYTARPGRRYPIRPTVAVQPAGSARGLIGGLAGLLLCLLCLATLGLIGLFATFVAVTAYLGSVYRAVRDLGSSASGPYMNMTILLAALCFAGYHKLRRSL